MKQRGPGTGKFARIKAMLRSDAARPLTSTQIHILRILWMEYARLPNGSNEAICYPSIKTIAHDARCSTKTVERALDALESAGFVSAPSMEENRPVRTLYLNRGSDTVSQPLRHCVREAPTLCPRGSDTVSKPFDIVSAPIRKNRIEPDIEPDRDSIAPPKATWLRVILPDGMTVTPEDEDAAGNFARHVRQHYPSTLKIQHRPPVNEIMELAAPHLVAMAETHGTIAAACEAATKAVDAVADFARENPARAGFVYGLERWLSKGGLDYPDPLDFMPHLRPKAEAKLTKMQEHEIGNHDERSWLDAG